MKIMHLFLTNDIDSAQILLWIQFVDAIIPYIHIYHVHIYIYVYIYIYTYAYKYIYVYVFIFNIVVRFCTNSFVDPIRRRYCTHVYQPTDIDLFEKSLKVFVVSIYTNKHTYVYGYVFIIYAIVPMSINLRI
jgi:ABC-type multidrug transport system fused ATPase/permease subunit